MRSHWVVCWATLLAAIVCVPVLDAARQGNRARLFLESYEQGVLTPISTGELPALISSLGTAAPEWVSADPSKSLRRHQLVALGPLELAAQIPAGSRRDLLEWACEFLRKGKPDDFELLWMQTAFGLLMEFDEQFGYNSGAGIHAKHARSRFQADPRLQLAEILSRPEAITFTNTPKVDERRLINSKGHGEATLGSSRQMNFKETTQWLEKLSSDPVVGAESTLRLGVIEFLRGQTDPALAHLQSALQRTTDPYLQNLGWLMQGLIAEAGGDSHSALTSFRSAFTAQPTVTAATTLAVSLFLSGQRSEAASILSVAYRSQPLLFDPWHHPIGAKRHAVGDIGKLRAMAGLPASPASQDPQTRLVSSPVPGTTESARTVVQPTGGDVVSTQTSPQFRASTSSVMVDVAVLDGKVPVRGLVPNDFEIFDNGVRQAVDAQSTAQVPLDVSIVLEMNERQAPGIKVWSPVQSLRDVSAIAGLLKPTDRIRLIVAAIDGPAESLPMQAAASAREGEAHLPASAISNRHTSTLFDGTAAALMAPVPPDRRGLVLIFTDGIDGASVLTPKQVTAVARESDAVVYLARRYTAYEQWMHLHPKSQIPDTEQAAMLRPIPTSVIEDVARTTGGLVRHPEAAESMVTFFQQVLEDFRGRYVFHYTPEGVSQKGWHVITVRLKSGRHTVIARRGYFAG